MKGKSIALVLTSIVQMGGIGMSATVILDDFSSGPFSIGSSEAARYGSPITSPLAGHRSIGANLDETAYWSASVDTLTSTFVYSANNPSSSTRLSVTYSNAPGTRLDLLGFNAFVLQIESLNGVGRLFVFEGIGSTFEGVIPVELNDTGELVIPFANMNSSNPTNPSEVTFFFNPQSEEFSIRLSSISVIPEPSVPMFTALGLSALAFRRHRKTPAQQDVFPNAGPASGSFQPP